PGSAVGTTSTACAPRAAPAANPCLLLYGSASHSTEVNRMGRLDGKVAVITGGASGMGTATAKVFVAEGARVVIGDVQREKAEAVAASIGPNCRYVECDVSSSEDVAAMVGAAVQSWGRLDVIFNNAGIGGGEGSLVDCTEDVWNRTIAVDLTGVWLGMKHAI